MARQNGSIALYGIYAISISQSSRRNQKSTEKNLAEAVKK